MSKQRREIKSVHIYEGKDDSALLDACYILITARRARLAAEVERLREREADLANEIDLYRMKALRILAFNNATAIINVLRERDEAIKRAEEAEGLLDEMFEMLRAKSEPRTIQAAREAINSNYMSGYRDGQRNEH